MKKIISRFLALAMLITSCQFTAASANEPDAKVWGDPNFTENFANYTSDDIEYDSSGNYYRLGDGVKTVAANPSGAKWVTSNEWKSLNGDGKVFVNYQDGRMGINGCGSGWTSSINLDMGDVRIDKLERLTFKTSTDNRAQGMMMFVSEDEKNWIMFGSRNGEGVDYTSQGNAPFVIKCVNGTRSLVSEDTQTWGGGYHGYNWDIQADGNTITWTVIEEGTDLTWTDSYIDTDGIISAEWKYPCAAYSIGDGWGYIYNAQMWYKEAKVWGEPNFTENFANYTSDDIEYDSSNNYYRLGDGVKTVAANPSGAKWVTSNEWKSLNGDGKVFVNYQDGRMGINGCGSGWTSSINLDMGDVRIDKLERLTFKTSTDNRAQGMMMFVSEDEKNWIMFGSRNGEGVDYTSQGNAPFVIKCVNGTRSLVSEDTQTWGGGYHGYNWDIQADGNTITWTVIEEGTNLTWTDSYTDTDGIISAEWKYPCAAYSIGDGWGYIYNAQLWYTKAKYDKFTENFANYTSADVTYNSDRNYWRFGDGAKALVTNPSGAKWVTSKVWTALNGDGKAFISYDNGRIGINGCGSGYISSVNLDMGDVRAETIGELKFRTSTDNRAQGMMMFVSEDEKNWIMFGSRNGEGVDYTSQGNAPFVIKCVNGTRSLVSEDTQTWGGGYHGYNWDIQVDGNKITWSVAEEGTNLVWTNSYTDTDGIISANWKYPCAAYSIGDGWGYVYSAEMLYTKKAEWNYEKKAYTKVELDALLEDAAYNSDDVHKLLGLDLNSVKQNTGSAAVTVGTDGINAGADLDGVECEFVDSYDLFFNEDGSLKEDYVSFAKSMPKISSFRLGGTASAKVNFMNTIGALSDRKESTFITLPENTDWTVGEKSADVMKMGVVEYLKVIYANNPNASFIPCISMMTMTPEETAELVHFLTDDASTDWGAKRAALGIENPVNVKYMELTNECDQYTDSGRAWYTNLAKEHIAAINAANANVKVMACGPTAPWGNGEWKSWVEYIAENLGTQIDAISFHPYYYGHETGTLLEYIKEIKAIIDKKIPGNNIKISLTEHGRDWGLNKNGHTSNMLAAVMQSYFLQEVSKLDYVDGAYMNGFITTESDLWQYWINKNGEWYTSPLQKAMALVGGSMGAKTLDTTVNYTDNTGAWPEDLSSRSLEDLVNVTAQQVSDNEIKLIMSNIAAYTDVDLAFNLGEKYDLVKEEVLSSPNMDTYAYDKYSADLTTVSADETEKENFTSYKLPAMKIVVLTLKKSDGSKKLTEDFSSYGEVAEKSGEDADKLLVSNANGTKWSLSETKTGYAEIGLDEVYGAASITGGKLVMTSEGQEEEFAVNWNTADFAGLDNISRIKFTLANEAGVSAGVRLFVNSDETASVELTNAAAGFDGAVSVDWVCELGSGTLTWSATDGNTVKTGSVSYSDANYAYLMQVFTKAIGSENFAASIDDIEVKYGASQGEEFSVTYTQSDTQYTVTVNPGQYSSVWVAAAYYAEDGSLIKVCTKTITQNDTLNAAKPDKAYSSFKVFCWDGENSMLPVSRAK